MVLFGGFNLDPGFPFSFEAFNPMDIWISKDGIDWVQTPGTPWNATNMGDIKYDFDAIVVPGTKKNSLPAIITVGGDRETFNFFDPFNYLRVDNDVWRFYPLTNIEKEGKEKDNKSVDLLVKAYPNPFKYDCNFEYDIPEQGRVSVKIYSMKGYLVKRLYDQNTQAGSLSLNWDGNDESGRKVKEGMYYVKTEYKERSEVNIVVRK